jgi:uncharacterized protein (UPF0305 family)
MTKTTKTYVKFIQSRYESEVTRALISYLETRLQELRVDHDDAVANEVIKNQGAIGELKQFLIDLRRKPVEKTGDGAYR